MFNWVILYSVNKNTAQVKTENAISQQFYPQNNILIFMNSKQTKSFIHYKLISANEICLHISQSQIIE